MNSEKVVLLTRQDVSRLLAIDDCISAVEQAFRMYGEGKAPAPGVLGVHMHDGGFHIKAGVLELNRSYFAAKVNGNFPENPGRFGLPTIQGMIVLADAVNGRPLAVMDSMEITTLRTGAATAVAAKYLARPDSRVATICGCGNQGRIQLRALSRVVRLARVFAYDVSAERSEGFAGDLSSELKIPVTAAASMEGAVRESDICITCTPAREPFLSTEHIVAGTFVAAVGADNPAKQELHPALMAASKIVTDVTEQCIAMGDLHHAIKAGAVSSADVYAELGDVVAGKKPGRTSDEEIIVFDSTGMALQDVAAAAMAYEMAVSAGVGVRLDFA